MDKISISLNITKFVIVISYKTNVRYDNCTVKEVKVWKIKN